MLTCLAAAVCVCVRACVLFPRGAPLSFHLLAPRLATRQPRPRIHPTCFARRNRYETDSHDRPRLKEMSVGGPDKLMGPRSWAMGGHLAAIMTGGELWSWCTPSLSWGKDTNRRNKCAAAKDTGSCAWCGAYRVTWGLNLFSVSMTDLIAIPFTHGRAIYRLLSLGDYLYMNKCQRIGYLLQGALQYDWLAWVLCSWRFREPTVPPCVCRTAQHAASKKYLFGVLLKRGEEIKWTLKSEPPSASVKPRVILDGCSEIPPEWRVDPEAGSQSANLSPTNQTRHRQSTLQIHSVSHDCTEQAFTQGWGGGGGSSSWVKREIMEGAGEESEFTGTDQTLRTSISRRPTSLFSLVFLSFDSPW